MIRLHITAEGQTEQSFAGKVLAPHLAGFGVFVDARCVLTSRDKRKAREYRGGLLSYEKAEKDIRAWLKEDDHVECRFTTMFDLYALPDDFPGYAEAMRNSDPYERVAILEQKMAESVGDSRFIPYIQLHEFEALLLADPKQLDWEYLEHDVPIGNLVTMVASQNPELINDGPATAPSKRILSEIPEYDKVTAGVAVAEKIGLLMLRQKCRHFNDWLTRLERLAQKG
ncbi:MAG: DUF4276 family protein [Candidatus Electrothrix sp. GW3-4]|uniref:DUF4276 family protein n=1 Tax=Candidatus Electrothrix sp. GW3-4 TaxID=3126740 RepID=UPI0030CFF27C